MADIKDRTIIISGAARGLGKSHARLLAARGANVVLTDLLAEEGNAIAAEIGPRAHFVAHDVRDATSWANVIRETEARFGTIHALVNNAGIGSVVPFNDLSEAEFRRFIDINQIGVFLGMKAVVPSMRRAGGGSIVNISSTAGIRGRHNILAYVATKFAVTGMSKAAAIDLAADNIRVNSVHPGVIGNTNLTQASDDYVKPKLAQIPLGRFGKAEEVSHLILYLVSNESAFCTGAEFVIDGGQTAA